MECAFERAPWEVWEEVAQWWAGKGSMESFGGEILTPSPSYPVCQQVLQNVFFLINLFGCTRCSLDLVACELLVAACGIYLPGQGSNSAPLHWECGVSASGPSGKSPIWFLICLLLFISTAPVSGPPWFIPGPQHWPPQCPSHVHSDLLSLRIHSATESSF